MPGSPRSFSLEDLIECYRTGVFPMAEARDDDRIFLVDPDDRGVIPLEAPHISRRLARTVRSDLFQVRVDTAFSRVIAECAKPRPGRRETWINQPIEMMYRDLFAAGLAHSVECWIEDELVGGLYGVSLNGAFFGESMFSVERDASKVALVHLIGRLRYGGYRLLDTQFITEHLTQFGAVQIPRATYKVLLKDAVRLEADFYRLPAFTGEAVLQAINHTS